MTNFDTPQYFSVFESSKIFIVHHLSFIISKPTIAVANVIVQTRNRTLCLAKGCSSRTFFT